MKTQTLFLVTHGLVAAATAGLMVIGFQTGLPLLIGGGVAISIAMIAAAAWWTSLRIQSGLSVLESVVADQENSESLFTGLDEFDRSAQKIGAMAGRWETVASDTRMQARDFQSLMLMLNRRGAFARRWLSLEGQLKNPVDGRLIRLGFGYHSIRECESSVGRLQAVE